MKYSQLFGKTVRSAQQDMKLVSHRLLYQAGFVRESTAGRYYFLPLGQRAHDKIAKIVEEEMNAAGAQKMFAPVLHPIELWEETNRNKSGGYELMTVEDRRGAKFALGGTAEEMFVDVVRGFVPSYKDLPFNIYQFGYKFRDELRSRGGLLRVREFVMKDGYSFHVSDEDFRKEYQNMWETYQRSFQRMGLKVDVVPADNGYFGGEYCHEFIVECEAGESTYYVAEDGNYIAHEDIATFKRDDINIEEAELAMEVVEQPEWVQTMEHNVEHYKLPKSRFLKNVVYKNRESGEIIIATIRGDLEVNKNKLEHVLDMVGLLEDATDEDLASIGTKSGYVHSWGHKKARYVGDLSLRTVKNFIGGQKEDKTDTRNVNYGRDFEHEITADIAKAAAGFMTEDGKSKLIEKRGVEVGNIFQLGQHYSLKMRDAIFVDSDGERKPFYMGCYGIGIGRSLATIAEVANDERGLVWPISVAPYQVYLASLGKPGDETSSKSEELYQSLTAAGIEVLYDERDERAGVKFADADLIGLPIRLVVSSKSLAEGSVEVKLRSKPDSYLVKVADIESEVKKIIATLFEELKA